MIKSVENLFFKFNVRMIIKSKIIILLSCLFLYICNHWQFQPINALSGDCATIWVTTRSGCVWCLTWGRSSAKTRTTVDSTRPDQSCGRSLPEQRPHRRRQSPWCWATRSWRSWGTWSWSTSRKKNKKKWQQGSIFDFFFEWLKEVFIFKVSVKLAWPC